MNDTMECVRQFLIRWQVVAAIFTAIGTISLALWAVYRDTIRQWFYRPKLHLRPGPFYPDSNIVRLSCDRVKEGFVKACYLQLEVINKGLSSSAQLVEVYVEKLEKFDGKRFQEDKKFYSMNLLWRHYDQPVLNAIPPRSRRFCTIGRISDPQYKSLVGDDYTDLQLPNDLSPFRLHLAAIPNTRNDLLPPGKYRLTLAIGGSNSGKAKIKRIVIQFSGQWRENARDMIAARVTN
jgi:hypothetical protein